MKRSKGISDFQPARLAQVLAARRLSQVQLAAMVGVSAPTVSKWRSGQQVPESETLERLASVVNVMPEWFTRPASEPTSAPLFRSNASAHAAAREMLEVRLAWAQDVALLLGEFVEYPALALPERGFRSPVEIDDGDIEQAAAECRSMWGLGSGPIPDLALALENAGVIVVREETGVASIEGLSAWSAELGRPMVLLASDKDNGFRSRFDAAHELGHLVLHKHIPRATERKLHSEMEKQAHRFAGALLLPAESFAAEVRLPATLDSLVLLKQRWGVSVAAIIMRLEALGIISEADKLTLFKRRSARWGAKSEPGDKARQPEQPRLLRRTIELLASSGVMPLSAVCRHLGISARDIESLTNLPTRYLDGSAAIVEFPALRVSGTREKPASSDVSATLLPFQRRQRTQ